MKSIKKILTPTDFSFFSLAGIEYATSFARLFDSHIYLLHVIPQSLFVAPYSAVDVNSETFSLDSQAKAKTELEKFINDHVSEMTNITPVIRLGEPSREIVRFAQEQGVDLIIIATHGRTGLAHILMGSIAEKVVRNSPVPVITIKPEDIRDGILDQKDIEEQLHLYTDCEN